MKRIHLSERAVPFLQSINWGAWSLLCLYLSLISGIIVGLHYNLEEPFYSASALDVLIPYGSWFRSLHFWSSQLFFLFAVLHFLVVFDKAQDYDFISYCLLILSFPVVLLLLFTGYVLRYDTTGFSAGMIAEHIVDSIPLIGESLNTFLFSISSSGLQRVYLHHICSFDLLFFILAWDHLRRYYRINIAAHATFLSAVLLFCVIVGAPIDPEQPGMSYITGPWFFLGLQELLRYLPPLMAGIVTPLSLVIFLVFLRKSGRLFGFLLTVICLWLLGYLGLSLAAIFLHS